MADTRSTRLSEKQRKLLQQAIDNDPVAWMEQNFWIEDPRDPNTGELFEPGPIQLSEHQKRIIRSALVKINGKFAFTTIIYSTIKKSGKTRIAAGIAAWYAATQGNYNEVYCLANDGKQSSDRILSAIRKSVELSPTLDWRITKTKITLPNNTFIEAIPCDPSGQAGSNPGLTVWSELWGYRHEHKARLWSEMTIPPTRFGHALRWVESYAGFTGESHTLENLYNVGKINGKRHPAFEDVPVYVNVPARTFCYWDEDDAARRMAWQTDEYYAQEASLLTPEEFDRIHRNQWTDPVTKAIPIEWWDRCADIKRDGKKLPPLDKKTPVVLGVDAALSHDSCALVVTSRHPNRPDEVAERATRVWTPPRGHAIDLSETVEKGVREFCDKHNVVAIVYDKYQLHKMATDLRKEGLGWFKQFDQGTKRSIADKQLLDLIIQKSITHTGNSELRTHIDNTAKKETGTRMRFVKPDQSNQQGPTKRPIDATVALSMSAYECLRLNL